VPGVLGYDFSTVNAESSPCRTGKNTSSKNAKLLALYLKGRRRMEIGLSANG